MNRYQKKSGFALIEVLITVVLLSVGLLGLAGLQTLSMRNNQSAYLRSQASLMAYDILDRMRANTDSALAGSYVTAYGTAPSGTVNCDSAVCSSANTAQFDLNYWKCSLGNWNSSSVCSATLGITGVLPNGDGKIVNATGNIYTVSIQWLDRDGNTTTFEVSTEL